MGLQKQIQDWPFLNKYKQKNKTLLEPASGENRIVFMGDSITEFWSNVHPEFFQGKSYVNRGISGQTSPQMLLRFRTDVIQLKPITVVILAGGNDIAGNTGPSTLETILNNIFSMTELAQANQIKVILCSVLPANYFYWNPKAKPADAIIALNKNIKSYAELNNIPFVDYHSAMVDDKNGLPLAYSNDGVHPNKTGYQVMESLIERSIQLMLETL
jgi:lysophospholipase L1-like esterase